MPYEASVRYQLYVQLRDFVPIDIEPGDYQVSGGGFTHFDVFLIPLPDPTPICPLDGVRRGARRESG